MKICYGCMQEKENQNETCQKCGYTNGQTHDEHYYLPEGSVLNDRYIVGKVLGHGGFGITYIGRDQRLSIVVAIKEYLPSDVATRSEGQSTVKSFSGDKKEQYDYGMSRFLDEARTLAQYNKHPCIVSSLDFFEDNNTAYLVMEYLDGIPLAEYLKRKGDVISWDEMMEIMTPIMDALREVHQSGLIHRDISPDNIFITKNGQVKLLDFGAARFALGEKSKSLSVVLKPGYAPPEQYSSRGKQGPWTDVYAVAATMYRCVGGEKPLEAMDRMRDSDLAPVQGISTEFNKVIEKALSIYNEERYQSIDEFYSALKDPVHSVSHVENYSSMKEETVQQRADKKESKKGPFLRYSVFATGFVIILILAVLIGQQGDKRNKNISNGENHVIAEENSKTEAQNEVNSEDETIEEQESNEGASSVIDESTDLDSDESLEESDAPVSEIEEETLVQVPNLMGLSQTKALESLKVLNLNSSIIEEETNQYDEGEIFRQDIGYNSEVEEGTVITITVAVSQRYSVPDIIGLTQSAAINTLINSNLNYMVYEEATNTYEEGIVFKQSINAYSEVVEGTEVSMTVAIPDMVFVPNLVGENQDVISSVVNGALGYSVQEVYSDSINQGVVISQTLPAGSEVKSGSQIQFQVSLGPEPPAKFVADHDPLHQGLVLTLQKMGEPVGEELLVDDVLKIVELHVTPKSNKRNVGVGSDCVYTDYSIYHISSLSQLTNLRSLNLAYHEVSDITGISKLTKLTRLSMYNNNVSDISPIGGMTNLTLLDLNQNYVRDISVIGGLTNLTYLNISYAKDGNISVLSGLTKLEYLDLGGMTLNDLSVLRNFTVLEELWLYGANITDTSENRAILEELKSSGCKLYGNPLE